jgi:hypothetical protein
MSTSKQSLVTDDELRQMIRASIARFADAPRPEPSRTLAEHASFARLAVLRSGDADGACLIEPTVRCNHCGYCLSYGH